MLESIAGQFVYNYTHTQGGRGRERERERERERGRERERERERENDLLTIHLRHGDKLWDLLMPWTRCL